MYAIVARDVTSTTAPEGEASNPERLIMVTNFFEELMQVMPEP